MNAALVLAHARTHAMQMVSRRQIDTDVNIDIRLDVKGVDPTVRFFLCEVPYWLGLWKDDGSAWDARLEGDTVVYWTHPGESNKRLSIHVFEHEHAAYVGLYDEANGKRWSDECIVIWDKAKCDVVNYGHAQGRCPGRHFHAECECGEALSA